MTSDASIARHERNDDLSLDLLIFRLPAFHQFQLLIARVFQSLDVAGEEFDATQKASALLFVDFPAKGG